MKKVFTLIAVVLLCLAVFASCGKDSGTDENGSKAADAKENVTTSAHVHEFGDWVTVSEATPTQDGVQERICASCSEKETQPIKYDFESAYANAMSLIEQKKYTEACDAFKALGDYKDSAAQVANFKYVVTEYSITNGIVLLKDVIAYNENGLPVNVDITSTRDNNTESHTIKLTYNDNGQLITYAEDDGYKCEYTYDANGNLISETEAEEGKIYYSSTYTYNNKNLVTSWTEKYLDYDSTYVYDYEYDANDNLIKVVYKDYEGEDLIGTENRMYEYDAKNQFVKYSNDSGYTVEFTYDANGNVTKKVSTYSEEDTYTEEYTYDKDNNLIKITNPDDKDFHMDFTYDENGNLISQSYDNSTSSTRKYEFMYSPYELNEMFNEITYYDIMEIDY